MPPSPIDDFLLWRLELLYRYPHGSTQRFTRLRIFSSSCCGSTKGYNSPVKSPSPEPRISLDEQRQYQLNTAHECFPSVERSLPSGGRQKKTIKAFFKCTLLASWLQRGGILPCLYLALALCESRLWLIPSMCGCRCHTYLT